MHLCRRSTCFLATSIVSLALSATPVAVLPAHSAESDAAASLGTVIKIEKSVSKARTGPFFDTLRVKPGTKIYFRIRLTSYAVEPIDANCRDEMCHWYEEYRLTRGEKVEVMLGPMVAQNSGIEDQHLFNVATVSFRDPQTGKMREAHDICHVVCSTTDPPDDYGQLLGGGEYLDLAPDNGKAYNNFAGDVTGFEGAPGIGKWAHLRKRDGLPGTLFVLDTDAGDSFRVTSVRTGFNYARYFDIQGYGRCYVEGREEPTKVVFSLSITDAGEDGTELYILRVTGPPGTNTTYMTRNHWKVYPGNPLPPVNSVVVRLD